MATPVVELGQLYLRLASPRDVPHIRMLIVGLARFEKLEHECFATDEKLHRSLFDDPARAPFKGPTVVMLEVGSGIAAAGPGPAGECANAGAEWGGGVQEEAQQYEPKQEGTPLSVEDSEKELFASTYNPLRTIAAFALVFPNYSTFLACPGLYLEDLYVREQYRRCGLGTCLLRYLARTAHRLEMGRLDWSVLDWNEKAISFYTQRMGASLMKEWRICRLEGSTLEAAATAETPKKPTY